MEPITDHNQGMLGMSSNHSGTSNIVGSRKSECKLDAVVPFKSEMHNTELSTMLNKIFTSAVKFFTSKSEYRVTDKR